MLRTTCVAALGAFLLGSCLANEDPPPAASIHLTLVTPDFRTDYGTDPYIDNVSGDLGWSPSLGAVVTGFFANVDTDGFANEMLRSIWVVSLETGQRVPGEVRSSLDSIDGEPTNPAWIRGTGGYGTSFVPSGDLAPGWYVVAVDLSHLDTYGTVTFSETYQENDVMFARIHVGPNPVWNRVAANCQNTIEGTPPSCDLELQWSEEVVDLEGTSVEVRVDGTLEACTSALYTHGALVTCPYRAPETEFSITLVSPTIRSAEGESNPSAVVTGYTSIHGPPLSPRFGVDVAMAAR